MSALTITAQPAAVTGYIGQNATLTAQGTGATSYNWYKLVPGSSGGTDCGGNTL